MPIVVNTLRTFSCDGCSKVASMRNYTEDREPPGWFIFYRRTQYEINDLASFQFEDSVAFCSSECFKNYIQPDLDKWYNKE